jgi:hypothetical protein
VRVQGLTDGLLLQLAAAGCRLQHLRLEHCYTTHNAADRLLAAFAAATSSSEQVVSFSSTALLQLVEDSCALSLRSLTLRHAGGSHQREQPANNVPG